MTPRGSWERAGRAAYLAFCAAVFVFLIAPIVVIVPLSFNAEPYFTFTEGMLRLDPAAYSLRWYRTVVGDPEWLRALFNSCSSACSPPPWRPRSAPWPPWA